jgi:hypothetical protein
MLSTYYERGRRSGHPPTERIIVHSSDKARLFAAMQPTRPIRHRFLMRVMLPCSALVNTAHYLSMSTQR